MKNRRRDDCELIGLRMVDDGDVSWRWQRLSPLDIWGVHSRLTG